MRRNFQGFVEAAIDAIADAHAALGRLDVDIAGSFADGVVENVVYQADDGRLAGDFGHVADVLDRLFDERDVGAVGVFDDVVDHEDFGVRQVADHAADVPGGGRDDLHLEVRHAANFFDEEEVRRFRHGQREHAADDEQRQHEVLLDVLARQDVHDFCVQQPGVELRVGDAKFACQAFDDLILGAEVLLDEDLAQQMILPALLLLSQRGLQTLRR